MTRWNHLALRERGLPEVANGLRTRADRLENGAGTVRPVGLHPLEWFWQSVSGSATITHQGAFARSGSTITCVIVASASSGSLSCRLLAAVNGVLTYGTPVVVGVSSVPPGGVSDSTWGGVRVPLTMDFPAAWLSGDTHTLGLEVTGSGQVGVLSTWQR